MTAYQDTLDWICKLLETCTVPLVVDADAINVLAQRPETLRSAKAPVTLTPHPGELARLLGCSTSEIQSNRMEAAAVAVEKTSATVVLKGAGTIVAQQGEAIQINMTGNPGMASGGSGDVLAGILAGLVGQGIRPFDAARIAVYLHGRSGDMVAWRKSQQSTIAEDLIDELP